MSTTSASDELRNGLGVLLFPQPVKDQCGANHGDKYQFRLAGDPDYGDANADPSDPDTCPANDPSCINLTIWTAGSEVVKGHWYDVVLHVRWDTAPCSANCNWDNPDGGAVELWINGQDVVHAARPTIARWPAQPICDKDADQYPQNSGAIMCELPKNRYLPRRETAEL